MQVCMVAGDNADYVFSLVEALCRAGLHIELLGGNEYQHPAYASQVTFVNVRGSSAPNVPYGRKISRLMKYYYQCTRYLLKTKADVIHIQSFRFFFLETFLFVCLPKYTGKKVVYTAHNVQQKRKVGFLGEKIFKVLYQNIDHTICHTQDIKDRLVQKHNIDLEKVTVVQRGLNSTSTYSAIDQHEARRRLDIDTKSRTILLFGRVRPDKGYEIAIEAFQNLPESLQPVQLLIVGTALRKDNLNYLFRLEKYVKNHNLDNDIKFFNYHIPEDEIELFFAASDVALFPYLNGDFQSGVLFLTYRYGLPVIASNLGSFPIVVKPDVNGYLFEVGNPLDLAAKINQFYQNLYCRHNLRQVIQDSAKQQFCWSNTARATVNVYQNVLQQNDKPEARHY